MKGNDYRKQLTQFYMYIDSGNDHTVQRQNVRNIKTTNIKLINTMHRHNWYSNLLNASSGPIIIDI